MKDKIQKFGRFLSGMVMPNIGAFIAWGLITALFIPDGWVPNEKFGALVGPMITYLLPTLIAYTGGKMIHGVRGGVAGATAAFGVIVGADIPMFLGAMIVGPLAGYVIKKVDAFFGDKIPAGFEMLVNNFSLGIFGMLLGLFSVLVIGPVVSSATTMLGNGVQSIVNAGLLPFASLLVEPAKVLFLNNAINHGVLGPLGIEQAAEVGRSIFFLVETNPGPGLGILLACMFFSKGNERQSAPGAIIIHFFGGIHEIYFPYILMQPLLIIAAIAGGAAGVLTFQLLDAGLIAAASPGSIFALMFMTPKGATFSVLLGVLISALVSFVVAAIIYRFTDAKESLEVSTEKVKASKGVKDSIVKEIVFACDAGMGSSAMGATTLQKRFNAAGIDIKVVNTSIDALPKDATLVVTHKSLQSRAQSVAKDAEIVAIDNFLGAPEYDALVKRFEGKGQ
ncbi:MAG TPA: PTS mannitol transporter subunit IICB [Erysipelothrix sp.]|nr:PTS mannitol transporter subunit IICB [Erysipelothrix sp.]